MKFLNFYLFVWVIFALLDLDPDSKSGYGSTDLIEKGSNPDPKHHGKYYKTRDQSGGSIVRWH